MPLAPGTLVNNRYRIVSILGQGGMGAVYRASDEHLLIPVAVKENLFLTEEYGRQFQREAHILAGLRHPNLPHVSDYFMMENQGQYLVMDYVEGEDLRQRMERMGILPERETILIGISICDALTYLHTRNAPIVHRDIKPGNIKVTPDGQAVLVDFGLAKIMQGAQVTSTGARAMTPGYSPPEQYGTARTDYRSDIYSLGATLYATLTGVIPEDGLARMTGKAKLTPIRDLSPRVNRRLADAIEKALEVDPDDRYQTAEEFKCSLIDSGELSNYYQDRPAISPPPSTPVNGEAGAASNDEPRETGISRPSMGLSRKQRRRRLTWTMASVSAVIVIGLAILLATNKSVSGWALSWLSPTSTTTNPPTGASPTQVSQTGVPALTLTQPVVPVNISATPAVDASGTPAPGSTATPVITPTVTETAPPTETPMGGGMGKIAFASDRSGIMQIYLMDVATKKAIQITGQKDGACQPTWSPDGMRLAFTSPCPGKQQDAYRGSLIYAINIDSDGKADRDSVVQLTSGLEGDYDPAWSPDGKRIAFTTLINDKPSIAILNVKDLSIEEISKSRYSDKQPAWDPSGNQIAFVRQFYTSQIWIMPDNGQPQNQFTDSGPVNDLWPAWSTDGQLIFYSQTSPDKNLPLLVYQKYEDRGKAKESHIPTNPKTDSVPVAEVHPSPDGAWLAFESWPDGINHDIYIMNINGANRERLTTDPAFDFDPAWRPAPRPSATP